MSRSWHIDSSFPGGGMAKACSSELRETRHRNGGDGASRREAAELYDVSASSAIKWVQRWRETGSITAAQSRWPRGGNQKC
jgi:transposase